MKTFDTRPLLLAVTAALLAGQHAAAQAPAPSPAPAASPAASAAPTASVATNPVTVAASGGTGVDWALKQDEIKNDPAGQWAVSATASSAYSDATGQARFSAWQATGAPNVDQEGDNGNAWAPKTPDSGIEWINLAFTKSVAATGLRIRESAGAGAVIKVELIDPQGTVHALWSGKDPTQGLNYLMLTFPKTDFKVDHVKITLATNLIPGWNEIDAVQLLGSDT
jgi:hypothetical protein